MSLDISKQFMICKKLVFDNRIIATLAWTKFDNLILEDLTKNVIIVPTIAL